MFSVPLAMDVQVAPNSVVYVGRVKALLHSRVGEEFRAGPLLPLLDQAVAGMSGNTWHVSTENLADTDLPLFRAQYPVLNSVKVDTAILPAFDRAAAQRFWEGESNQSAPTATARN